MPHVECRDCHQEMAPGNSCTLTTIKINGKLLARVPYANKYVEPQDRADHHCHDCNTPYGALHHLGCDMERCPVCGGQLISCGCWTNE